MTGGRQRFREMAAAYRRMADEMRWAENREQLLRLADQLTDLADPASDQMREPRSAEPLKVRLQWAANQSYRASPDHRPCGAARSGMPQYRHMAKCFLCKRQFQYGADIYEGIRVRAWHVMVCNQCRRANHDGIVPTVHPDLVGHLRLHGIQPTMNSKGWICWPDEPSPR